MKPLALFLHIMPQKSRNQEQLNDRQHGIFSTASMVDNFIKEHLIEKIHEGIKRKEDL